jgi:hypothetical protein
MPYDVHIVMKSSNGAPEIKGAYESFESAWRNAVESTLYELDEAHWQDHDMPKNMEQLEQHLNVDPKDADFIENQYALSHEYHWRIHNSKYHICSVKLYP